MQLDDWLDHARRDASRRGLPDLDPLLDMLFRSTRALRAADWARRNPGAAERAAGSNPADTGPPPAPPGNKR